MVNEDASGAIGQAVGALALVVVIIHARNGGEGMRRDAGLERLRGTREICRAQAANEDLVSAINRAEARGGQRNPFHQYFTEQAGLSLSEARMLGAYATAIWHNLETSIESIDRLSPGVRRELDNRIRSQYSRSIMLSKWFELSKEQLNPDAVRYVENVLAQPTWRHSGLEFMEPIPSRRRRGGRCKGALLFWATKICSNSSIATMSTYCSGKLNALEIHRHVSG